jgi:hypothetical protein
MPGSERAQNVNFVEIRNRFKGLNDECVLLFNDDNGGGDAMKMGKKSLLGAGGNKLIDIQNLRLS